MNETINVVIVENDANWKLVLRSILKKIGMAPTIISSMDEALNDLPHILTKEIVNFVLLDGNLSPNMLEGKEGRQLAEVIREHSPNTRIIGISSSEQDYADDQVPKRPNYDKERLKAILLGEDKNQTS